jgi:hypothetical protein
MEDSDLKKARDRDDERGAGDAHPSGKWGRHRSSECAASLRPAENSGLPSNDTRRQDFWRLAQDTRQLGAQETLSFPYRKAALQQEGADLIDDAGALADQPLPYPVQCLQVELIDGLGRHEFYRRPRPAGAGAKSGVGQGVRGTRPRSRQSRVSLDRLLCGS